MSPMLINAKREFLPYFDSPIAYIVICLSFFALGLMFFFLNGKGFWQKPPARADPRLMCREVERPQGGVRLFAPSAPDSPLSNRTTTTPRVEAQDNEGRSRTKSTSPRLERSEQGEVL